MRKNSIPQWNLGLLLVSMLCSVVHMNAGAADWNWAPPTVTRTSQNFGTWAIWTKKAWDREKSWCVPNLHPESAKLCEETENIRLACSANSALTLLDPSVREVCVKTGEWSDESHRRRELIMYAFEHRDSAAACAGLIKVEHITDIESALKLAAIADGKSGSALKERLAEIDAQRQKLQGEAVKNFFRNLKDVGFDLLAGVLRDPFSLGNLWDWVKNTQGMTNVTYMTCAFSNTENSVQLQKCEALRPKGQEAKAAHDAMMAQEVASRVLGSFLQCSNLLQEVANFERGGEFSRSEDEKGNNFKAEFDRGFKGLGGKR